MKINNIFFVLVLGLLIPRVSLSHELFIAYNPPKIYTKISNNYTGIHLSQIKDDIIFYKLDTTILDSILKNDISEINYKIPFFNNRLIEIPMELLNDYNNQIELTRHTESGKIIEQYSPEIKVYKIRKGENNINGVFIFSKKGVKAFFSTNNNSYQIDLFNQSKEGSEKLYFLSDINKSLIHFDFMCGNDLLSELPEHLDHSNYRQGDSVFGCLDIAIEIDYYTFQTFNSYEEAVNWALEMLAVADAIYLEEIELSIISNSAQIWEIEDPYSIFIDEPQNMLIALRDNWIIDEELSSINRDLVHLFSKRNNTGTGGIAFLNGIGSSWSGYGFSSNLTDEEDYLDLPVPYFFWNIYCLVHELGHNFGSKHTQWCGWPEGPIDNCANIEEVVEGECSDYINSPAPQVGTIMSYCHTWPFESGGGIIMKFDDYVKTTLIAYLGLQNLYDCDTNEEVFGCIDVNACNYDVNAETDDGGCIYPALNLDCFGNCLNDDNQNGICDENEILYINNEVIGDNIVLFPNPADEFINIKTDNLSVSLEEIKLFNSSGQLILAESLRPNHSINVSGVASGIYSVHVIGSQQINQQNIIIQ